MSSIFISHASEDQAFASEVKRWLREAGYGTAFLDFDADDGLSVGKDWSQQLYGAIRSSDALITLISPAWSRSRWCFAEVQQALALGKLIIPVVPVPELMQSLGPELAMTHAALWDEDGKRRIAKRLDEISHQVARGYRWDGGRSPWPGILSYDREDAAVFFGRDFEVLDLVHRLEARRLQGGTPFLALVGPSGSGKSSVMKAGVHPYLERTPDNWIVIPPFRPGTDPTTNLLRAAGAPDASRDTNGHEAALSFDRFLASRAASDAAVLILIDQLEELFSVTPDETRRSFLIALADIFRLDRPVFAIGTIRSDRLDLLSSSEASFAFETVALPPLPRSRLKEVIEGPADVAGIALGPGLADEMLSEVDSDSALPLLAFTLRELYELHRAAGPITVAEFRELGDPGLHLGPLRNAIRRKADLVVASANATAQELAGLKEVFVGRLVTLDDSGLPSGVPAPLPSIEAPARRLVDGLVDARLLVVHSDDGASTIEVAHDALLTAWPTLSKWLEEEREFLIARKQIEQAAAIYESAPQARKEDALLSGLLAERARGWLAQHPGRFGETAAFVERSLQRIDRLEARRRALVRDAFAAAVLLIAVLSGLVLWALYQQQLSQKAAIDAANERDRAVSNRSQLLAYFADQRNAAEDYATAIPLSLAALKDNERGQLIDSPEGARQLRDALWKTHQVAQFSNGSAVTAFALSPDGQRLAIATDDGAVRLYSTKGGAAEQTLVGNTLPVVQIAFAPDGKTIATAASNAVFIWDGQSGKQIRVGAPSGTQGFVTIFFDKSGQQVDIVTSGRLDTLPVDPKATSNSYRVDGLLKAAAGSSPMDLIVSTIGGVAFYNLATGERHPVFVDTNPKQVFVDFAADLFLAPDGSLAIFDAQGGVWIVPTGNTLATKVFDSDFAYQAMGQGFAVSPDGNFAVSARGKSLAVVQLSDGKILATLPEQLASVTAVHWMNNGEEIFSEWSDGKVRLFDVQTSSELAEFWADTLANPVVATSPGGTVFATRATDHVYVWGDRPIEDHFGSAPARYGGWSAFSDNGQLVAVSEDTPMIGSISILDLANGQRRALLPAHGAAVTRGEFSPDGTRLVTLSEPSSLNPAGPARVMLWDVLEGRLIAELPNIPNYTLATFSPDSKLLVTASHDGSVVVWRARDGMEVARPPGHAGAIYALQFSPDGALFATGSQDHTARLWKADGTLKATLTGHADQIASLDFSADGKLLATASGDHQIKIWDVATGTEVSTLTGSLGFVRTLRVLAGNNIVADSADGTTRIWNAKTGAVLFTSAELTNPIPPTFTVSPDRKLIAILWPDESFHVVTADGEDQATFDCACTVPPAFLGETGLLYQGQKLFDLRSRAIVGDFAAVATSPDGSYMVGGSPLYSVPLWANAQQLVKASSGFSFPQIEADPRYRDFVK